jgi:mRNA interferase RelE/StbE
MRLIIAPGARHDLRRLSRDVAERLAAAIDALPENPRPPGCLLLRDYHPPTWRIRVGAWRVLYRIDRDAGVVTVIGVRHRSTAYR